MKGGDLRLDFLFSLIHFFFFGCCYNRFSLALYNTMNAEFYVICIMDELVVWTVSRCLE